MRMGSTRTTSCPHCTESISYQDIEFTAADRQDQPGQALIEYSTTCPHCNNAVSGSAYLNVALD